MPINWKQKLGEFLRNRQQSLQERVGQMRRAPKAAALNKTTVEMEQFAARQDWPNYFKAKDRVFSDHKNAGFWPSERCRDCEYVACSQCGAAPLSNRLECPKCGAPTVIRHICCVRFQHHSGDCCVHCGNDER